MKTYYLIIVFILLSLGARAQDGSVNIKPVFDEQYVAQNLCGSLSNLIIDAAKGFVKAKGKEVETINNVTMWTSNIGLPGASTSSLLFATSWQYEGVIYQGATISEWKPQYDKYHKLLKACLADKGYDEVAEQNMAEDLGSYPELMYKKPSGDAASVSLKVDKAIVSGLYTLTINVWQAGK